MRGKWKRLVFLPFFKQYDLFPNNTQLFAVLLLLLLHSITMQSHSLSLPSLSSVKSNPSPSKKVRSVTAIPASRSFTSSSHSRSFKRISTAKSTGRVATAAFEFPPDKTVYETAGIQDRLDKLKSKVEGELNKVQSSFPSLHRFRSHGLLAGSKQIKVVFRVPKVHWREKEGNFPFPIDNTQNDIIMITLTIGSESQTWPLWDMVTIRLQYRWE